MRFILSYFLIGFFHLSFGQDLKYTVCENCWTTDSLGNHRALVQVPSAGKVAEVKIDWRRRDTDVERKNLVITDEAGNLIRNVARGKVNRESGELFFEPTAGKGKYFVYYMKYWQKKKSNYPTVVYQDFKETASPEWLKQLPDVKKIKASVLELQSIDALNSFYPMEVIATQAEVDRLTASAGNRDFMVFPEDRMNPVRMKDLPYKWAQSGPGELFGGTAARGENYAFQLGIFAHGKKLEDVRITFTALEGSGIAIPASSLSCINTSGVGWDGNKFDIKLSVEKGTVQPLWCTVTIPENLPEGVYKGTATIQSAGSTSQTIAIHIAVAGAPAVNHGVDEPWKQTRLAWLDSKLGSSNDVIAPYTPLVVNGSAISLLGRKLDVGDNGLPAQITSYFSSSMTSLNSEGRPMLTGAFDFQVVGKGKGPLKWTSSAKPSFEKESDGLVRWNAISTSDDCSLQVTGKVEFDGFATWSVKLTALRDADFEDISMTIPLSKEFAKYLMGLGLRGGFRPADVNWSWDVATRNQDGAWIGSVNGGIQFSLRAENYSRPLNTNFYLQKPLNLPPSWGNDGKGGIRMNEKENTVVIKAFSGARSMKKGEELHYNFTLLITPFHTLQTDSQWKTRYYHKYSPIDTILRRGATVVNIHHANEINPYINYPFLRTREMKAYIDAAHKKNLKVKIYNTVRELSNRAYETPVLRSLGTEIYSPGNGGGFSWLQEHLGSNYIAAWFVPELQDASIINSGMSRWHNYYVEGMSWLVKNVGIDGIYLDDVAFDRITMKRVKRVLQSDRGPGIIDLHSANQHNKRDGFNNSANLYLEHFPYLDRLWFGEYFDYDSKPDFWMTEVSGIPFGLMGEMLEGGGNPWRGMVYGMTNRMPWTDNSDPRALWKLWDDFGIQGSEMIGYWVDTNPVKSTHPEVLATIYRKKDAVLVSIASWASEDVKTKLAIDWKALGLKPAAIAEAPAIKNFQDKQKIDLAGEITVPKGKGFLIIIKP
ncbi:MAG: hypothetical protein JNK10_03510 [Cyclobacteriaceae bacterium]|nr:hypothetical protein [Cyclobacteriaceae bacterium]